MSDRRKVASTSLARSDRIAIPVKVTTLLIAACFAFTAPATFAADAPPGAVKSAKPFAKAKSVKKKAPKRTPATSAAAVPSTGMTVHIDPKTGEFLKEPAPGSEPLVISAEGRNAFSTSHEGLSEVKNPKAGGGYKLDLQGRFQSPLIATMGADGKIKMRHLHETPEPGEKK